MTQVTRTDKGSGFDTDTLETEVSESLQVLSEQLDQLVMNAKKIRSGPYQEFKDKLSHKLLWLRPSVGGISAISCCETTPQLGYSKISIRGLEKLLEQQLTPPKRQTPEKQLQSWLIRTALESGGRMKLLDDILGGQFWFVSDEIALRTASNKKIVADMLTVWVDTDGDGLAYLVNIELKSKRQMETFKQVISFRAGLEHPSLQDHWRRFAEAMTGEQFRWASSRETRGIVIWPGLSADPKNALANERRKGYARVDVIGYQEIPHYSLKCEKAQ